MLFILFFFQLLAAQSSTVITVNQGVRGGKVTELKKTVDTAVQSCPTVKQVFVAMRTDNPVTMTARDIAMEEVREQKANQILKIQIQAVESEFGIFEQITKRRKITVTHVSFF